MASRTALFTRLGLCVLLTGLLPACTGKLTVDPARYGQVRIHSHNDYVRTRPFHEAYEAGVASIEADVWLIDGDLYVAHDREDVKTERTLLNLYLEPLRQLVRQHGGKAYPDGRPLQLLVDLKNDGEPALETLVRIIEENELVSCFDRSAQPGAVLLTITGDSGSPENWGRFPAYVCFDGRPDQTLSAEQRERVPLISQSKKSYSSWSGFGKMKKEEQAKIRAAAEAAHAEGALFRLWGMPDSPKAWELTVSLGIDYINTDQPARAAAWLSARQTP